MTDFDNSNPAPDCQQRGLMAAEELDALVARGREALEGVTAGPWDAKEKGRHPNPYVCGAPQEYEFGIDRPVVAYFTGMGIAENSRFTAAARDLVPDLMNALTALRAERDEADRRAGAAERGWEHDRERLQTFARVRDEMKEQRGYHRNVSFDAVWKETCEKADRAEAAEAERDELRAAIFGSGDYCKTLRNGNFAEMAQATEAGRKGAIAACDAMIAEAVAKEREACARMVDCGCDKGQKAAVIDAENGADRARACGQYNCGAEDAAAIRKRGDG